MMNSATMKFSVRAKLVNKKYYFAAFLIPFLVAILAFLASMLNNGTFYIGSDFVHQQVPFWSYANSAVKSGNVFWNDSLDLGTPFIGGLSFYTIGSPFFWLSLLFPAGLFAKLSFVFLALKIGTAGLAAFCWLKQYTKKHQTALLCSLLYAFCGFQISNLNFNHFADVVALFPFLLLALDQTVLHNKRFCFALTAALCAVCNWFCFFGMIIFLVLYFVVKLWCKEYPKMQRRLFMQLAGESLLAVGLSAVIILPSILFMLSNPRASENFESVWRMIAIKPIYLADLVRGMLVPPECAFNRGFFLNGLFNGGELYLPLFGLVPAAAFVLSRRKSFEARLLKISLVFMLIPILNSVFVAFNAEYYTRWFFMPSLILCLATARTIEDDTVALKRGVYFYAGLWLALFAVFAAFHFGYKVGVIYNIVPTAVYMLISLAGFGITLFLRRFQSKKHGMSLLLIGVCVFAFATTVYNVYLMQKCWKPDDPKRLYTAAETVILPSSDEYYRIDADGYNFYNIGMMLNKPSMDSFSSTISPSVFKLYDLIEEPRSVISDLPSEYYAYRALFSAKYWVRYGTYAAVNVPGWQLYEAQEEFTIFANDYFLPMGFIYDKYITAQQVQELPKSQRHYALIHAMVLTQEQAKKYPQLAQAQSKELEALTNESFQQDLAKRRAQTATRFEKHNYGYTATIVLEKEELVFFSIPYDEGWSATVNGKSAEIETVTGGFMAIGAQSGHNEIEFIYSPKGFKVALGISVASALLLAVWAVVLIVRYRLKKNRNKSYK